MSDDMLSQDEIDALLKGAIDDDDDDEQLAENPSSDEYLSDIEEDALGEIGNISFGSSATALSTLLNQKVDITTPKVSTVKKSALDEEFPQPHVAIQVTYTKGFTGMNLLVIKSQDASIIADLMLGGDGTNPEQELTEIHLSAVQEAMNQMMGSAATSMSTIFNKRVDISPPAIDVLDLQHGEGTETIPQEEVLAKISFQLKIGNLIDSNIMQILPIAFAKDLVEELLNPSEEEVSVPEPSINNEDIVEEPTHIPNDSKQTRPQATETVQQNRPQTPSAPRQQQHIGGQGQMQDVNIQSAQFSEFERMELPSNEKRNLDMLLDIPLKVTVELGRTRRTIKEILELSSGSVIELDKLAGEPVDILVNEKLIAKGEVVVIDENFGVRVTDILSQSDRIKKLQ